MHSLRASQGRTSVRTAMTVSLCLIVLLVLAQPVLATPTGTSGTYVEVVGPPVVAEGEEFEISVTVRNVAGLFGGQFELSFDPAFLQGVDDSLQAGTDLEPSITGVSTVDNDAGSVLFAVSRQGDVEGLSGDVVLATMSFTATAQTEWTTISVSDVLLGDKDANSIASGDSVDLSLAITPGGASVSGQVTLEGRDMGSYDGSVVTIMGTELSAVTDVDGNFEFADVAPGTYAFEADADGYLPAVCESVDVVAPSTTLAPVELVAGDVNGDGMIDIIDAVAIGAAFGDAESNPAADLNDDGAVNILDLILMAVNFGASSPTTWECVDP